MNLGGMASLAYLLRHAKPSRKCGRCGLRYPLKAEQCPHCGELDEAGLTRLKQRIEQEHRSNASLGRLLLFFAAVIGAVLVLLLK